MFVLEYFPKFVGPLHFPAKFNGMVQAWVSQKLLKRDILRVFTMSDLLNI